METILAILAILALLGICVFGIGLIRYLRSGRYAVDTRLDQVGKGW